MLKFLRAIVLVAFALSLGALAAQPTPIGDKPTIRAIALEAGPEPGMHVLAMLSHAADGWAGRLLGRVLWSDGGIGPIESQPIGFDVADIKGLLPEVFFGTEADFTGRNYTIIEFGFDGDPGGSLRLSEPTTPGPLGDLEIDGNPTAVVPVPSPVDPWVAIATDAGRLILIRAGRRVEHLDVAGPIVDLEVVPQVGYIAIVALVNARDGQQHLVGVQPPDPALDPAGHAQIVFDLMPSGGADPSPVLAGVAAADITPGVGDPLGGFSDPTPVHLIAANGTRVLHRLTISEEPTIGGTFTATALGPVGVPIRQAATSSLALLAADGAGVLYDPAFNVNQGGISGRLFTVFGSSFALEPRALNLRSRGRFMTGVIEVADGHAAAIDAASVTLEVFGHRHAISGDIAPSLGDVDGDGNVDLTVKFDRAAIEASVPTGATAMLGTARWRFTDGSGGFASSEIRVVP